MPPYRNKTVGATLIVAAMLLAVQPVLVTGRDSRPYPAMADVPACARDVFLPLHRDKDHDNATSMCQGLLIRDNILLTSNECSKHNSVFRLPGVGFFQATPPRNKMKVANLDPRLGFLHTNVPYHKQSRDHRVQRNRVFLSLQSTDDNGTAMSMSCCMSTNGSHRPVAHNFPVDGEQVSLGHLHKAMPYVLWEHTDILTAPELVDGKQRWWTRYITLEEETKSMQAQIKKYNNGPPGSLSVWPEFYTEVLDPGGHRMEPCIQNYHQRYREEMPFSGESFFDWLDYGSGRHVMTRGYKRDGMKHFKHMDSDDECSKENLDRYKIHYFNDKERLAFEVHITRSDHGNHLIARYKQSGVLVPKTMASRSNSFYADMRIYNEIPDEAEPGHPHIYMWAVDEKWYIVDRAYEWRIYEPINPLGLLVKIRGNTSVWIKDDPQFLDAKGYSCADWGGWSNCASQHRSGYKPSEVASLMNGCPATCHNIPSGGTLVPSVQEYVKHSGILDGGPALSAGHVYVGKDGGIWGINFDSGHYTPTVVALGLMHQWMTKQPFNVNLTVSTAVHWLDLYGWGPSDCKTSNWSSIHIPGYDNAALNRSCYEATLSPTFVQLEDLKVQTTSTSVVLRNRYANIAEYIRLNKTT